MRKYVIQNFLYTLGMALAVIVGYEWGIAKGNYIFAAGALGLVIIFAIQKIKILKKVNKSSKP